MISMKPKRTFNNEGDKEPIVRGEMLADADCIIGHNIILLISLAYHAFTPGLSVLSC